MSRFDEEPDGDPHGDCAAEIQRLKNHGLVMVEKCINLEAENSRFRAAAQQAEDWMKWFCNEEGAKLPNNDALEIRQRLTAALEKKHE